MRRRRPHTRTHGDGSVGGAQCEGLPARRPVTAAVMFHLMRPLCGLLFKRVDRRILPACDRFPYVCRRWFRSAYYECSVRCEDEGFLRVVSLHHKWADSPVMYMKLERLFTDYACQAWQQCKSPPVSAHNLIRGQHVCE